MTDDLVTRLRNIAGENEPQLFRYEFDAIHEAADALATSAEKDAEIARLTSERAALAEAAANFWTAVDRAEAAEAEAAALRERLERSSKQIEYALTKASLSAPEKISDALSLARALQNKEQANG